MNMVSDNTDKIKTLKFKLRNQMIVIGTKMLEIIIKIFSYELFQTLKLTLCAFQLQPDVYAISNYYHELSHDLAFLS